MTGEIDLQGTVSSVPGFSAGATYAGIKTYGEGKLDVAIMRADRGCNVAASYTRNRLHAASVDVDREKLSNGRAQAVVVNAGVANASTGERGFADAMRVCEWVAERHGLEPDDVLVCSTGVIGQFLPMEKMEAGIAAIDLSPRGGDEFARAIMTTDTRPKHASVKFGPYIIAGCAKGSGMIHPNMATMLAFVATDAPIQQAHLQLSLSDVVDRTFNMVSVDGDTSPSDTVFLFSRDGDPGQETLVPGSELFGEFQQALAAVCSHLAREIARDGEGATRVIEATVTGAASAQDAREVARLLTTSYLLKSAIHGADPNWGRIVAVVGRSTAEMDEQGVTVDLCGVRVFQDTLPTDFDESAVSEAMRQDTVTVAVDLSAGEHQATGWGCDLTAEYVHINADYHT